MAAHSAVLTSEGEETIVRIAGMVSLPNGPITVREIEETGELVLAAVPEPVDTWASFLDDMSRRPRDEEFMKDRPMNRVPVDRKLFSED